MSLYVLVIWPTLSAHKTAKNKSGNETTITNRPNKWPPKTGGPQIVPVDQTQRVVGFAVFNPHCAEHHCISFPGKSPKEDWEGVTSNPARVWHCVCVCVCVFVCVCVCARARALTCMCTLRGDTTDEALEWKGVWLHINSANGSGSAAQPPMCDLPEREGVDLTNHTDPTT